MITRLETMILMGMDLPLSAIRGQLASGLDLIIHLGRLRDKSRKMLEINEVTGLREGKVELIVARDAGYIGSGCMTAVYLDGRKVSAIDNSEKITFYLTPGRYILGTGPNPDGVGLCRMGSERVRKETEIIAELGKPLKYRLAISGNGEISVMPTAF